MGEFSIWHGLIVLAIVLLIFGTKKLRSLGGDLGASIEAFQNCVRGESSDVDLEEGSRRSGCRKMN